MILVRLILHTDRLSPTGIIIRNCHTNYKDLFTTHQTLNYWVKKEVVSTEYSVEKY